MCVATLLCLAPFVNKAFNIDEPLFVWSAKHIVGHPLDPYGFSVNWYGRVQQMSLVMKNPPVGSYYLALAGSVAGWSEAALHIAMLIAAIAAVLGTYLLAARLCGKPLEAALATLFTPVFLVSSSTVMCDTMMLALFVWAALVWLIGLDRRKWGYLALSAFMIGICALTKYYGAVLLPLLLGYTVVRERKLGWWAANFLITVAILTVYQLVTKHLYGHGLLSDASAYATSFKHTPAGEYFPKALVGLSYTGGCLAIVLFYAARLWSRKWLLVGAVAVLAAIAALSGVSRLGSTPMGSAGSTDWTVIRQAGLMIVLGCSVLALAISDFTARRDPESVLLALWVIGTYVFASFVNWTVNGRSILPMAPAVGILLVRRVEWMAVDARRRPVWLSVAPLAAAGILALTVTWSDFAWANSIRDAARQVKAQYAGSAKTVWFEGHWGFQYYMEPLGFKAVDYWASGLSPGDIVVVSVNNTNIRDLPEDASELRDTMKLGGGRLLTTASMKARAGFYCNDYGPLAYAFGTVPADEYRVYDIIVPANR